MPVCGTVFLPECLSDVVPDKRNKCTMSGVVSRPKHDFVFDKHQFRKSNFQLKILDNCHHNESVFISDLDVRFGTNLVDKYQANTFFFEFFSRKF